MYRNTPAILPANLTGEELLHAERVRAIQEGLLPTPNFRDELRWRGSAPVIKKRDAEAAERQKRALKWKREEEERQRLVVLQKSRPDPPSLIPSPSPPAQLVEKKRNRRRKDVTKPKFTPAQRLFLRKLYGNACLNCGSVEKLCIDHVIPWQWTRDHSFDNWQLLCWKCNRTKSAAVAVDYRWRLMQQWPF